MMLSGSGEEGAVDGIDGKSSSESLEMGVSLRWPGMGVSGRTWGAQRGVAGGAGARRC